MTNGILAAELALKALTLKETGTFDRIHDIDKLFYALPDIHKAALSKLIKEKAHQNDATLKSNLEGIANFFVEWRYFFTQDAIGYSGFLNEFIHIVCNYAIVTIEDDVPDMIEDAWIKMQDRNQPYICYLGVEICDT